MPITESTYFGFTRVREMSPEAQNWASTDENWEILSKLLNRIQNHSHSGGDTLKFPGYDAGTPTDPDDPVLTEQASGGILGPGSSIGVRLSYLDANGLETDASPEAVLDLTAATPRPLTPELVSVQTAANALVGGNYIYVITKVKGAGETLPSDVLPVTVSYDQTYSVTLSFDPINDHNNPAVSQSGTNEGVTAINIYRSTGLSSTFSLIGEVTTGSQTQFTDTNTVTAENAIRQPPGVSTFDATKSVEIDWSAFTHPAEAIKLRVYVTRQPRLWSTAHLLSELDLTATPPDSIDYTGSETLGAGWPRNTSQILGGSPQINLATDATGGLLTTAVSDFQGFASNNFKLGGTPTVTKTNGMIWYDPAHTVQARINGSDITIGTVTGAYTHPAESSGGHIAANIPYQAGSATSVKTVLDRLFTSAGAYKQVQQVQKALPAGTGTISTTSLTPVLMTDMQITVSPDYDGQWVEFIFDAALTGGAVQVNASWLLSVNDVNDDRSVRATTVPAGGVMPASLNWHLQLADDALTYTIKVLWFVNAGEIFNALGRRALVVKKVL